MSTFNCHCYSSSHFVVSTSDITLITCITSYHNLLMDDISEVLVPLLFSFSFSNFWVQSSSSTLPGVHSSLQVFFRVLHPHSLHPMSVITFQMSFFISEAVARNFPHPRLSLGEDEVLGERKSFAGVMEPNFAAGYHKNGCLVVCQLSWNINEAQI